MFNKNVTRFRPETADERFIGKNTGGQRVTHA